MNNSDGKIAVFLGPNPEGKGLLLRFDGIVDDIKITPDPRQDFFIAFGLAGIGRASIGIGGYKEINGTVSMGAILEDPDQVPIILASLKKGNIKLSEPDRIIIDGAREIFLKGKTR